MVKITTLKVNQILVHDDLGTTFFSYDTPICTKLHNGNTVLYTDWCYSRTTSKYRSEFLEESTADTKKKLLAGEYTIERPYVRT